jgi:hypothetical protein
MRRRFTEWALCMTATLSAACSSSGASDTPADGAAAPDTSIESGPVDGSPITDASAGKDASVGPTDGSVDGSLDASRWPTDRPRVFIALTGSDGLVGDADVDDQWTYVRQNLDGIWGNNANFSPQQEVDLWHKIQARTIITEYPLPSLDAGWFYVGAFSDVQHSLDPNLDLNREAIALFDSHGPSDWNGLTVASASAYYVTNAQAQPWQVYKAIFTGWLPQDFQTALPAAAADALDAASGAFAECTLDSCLGGVVSDDVVALIDAVHAHGDPFVFFASDDTYNVDSGWPEKFQETYNHFTSLGLWRPGDVVALVNYYHAWPAVPETANGQPARTVTGMAYWALHQSPLAPDQ